MGGVGAQAGGAINNVANMSQTQQMEIYAMLEQQSQMLAQMFTPQQQQQMLMNGGMGGMQGGAVNPNFRPQQNSRSLFDRVQPNPRQQNNSFKPYSPNNQKSRPPPENPLDVELGYKPEGAPSADDTCKYNLACTNKDCTFAHQSPAAPPGTVVDLSDICSFGAACKNRKCTGRHPSPAQKSAHQVEQDCKFFPNCTNARCPFKHPSMPPCRNGADCTVEGCKFTHVKTMCRFNPCLNPTCLYRHEEGQRGKFSDKVWVAGEKQHVSERKFVDEEGSEELIVPGVAMDTQPEELAT